MLCSGIKECITVKDSNQDPKKIQKRLILFDLKELFLKWICETEEKIIPCLEFFTSLKPSHCIFAGKPGTITCVTVPTTKTLK